ncbi:hypothetical protein G9A89_002757 [Geosiphon pyriformis]|nr:hypothetical protein G9A89_002757 [Geosiphon pyriformis]
MAIEEPISVTTYQENFCYFHLKQYLNIQNLYTDKTKQLFDTTILQQLKQFLHTGFQDRPEILLNSEMDSIIVNQMRKITNAQFEELQNRITQVILKKEVQEILKDKELELRNLGDFDGA